MKKLLFLVSCFSVAATLFILRGLGQWELSSLRSQIEQAGFWAPVIYVLVYVIATALVLPSTVLNLMGGALFGTFWGTFWTTMAAVGSAIITFWITRQWIRGWIQHRLSHSLQNLDQEISQGGIFYLLAVRLLPVIPYGIVNYSAGITSVRFRDYLIGTSLGTVPGLLPFVMLGSAGVQAVTTGQVWPILLPLTLIGLLVAGATYYQRHQCRKN